MKRAAMHDVCCLHCMGRKDTPEELEERHERVVGFMKTLIEIYIICSIVLDLFT